MSRPYRLRLVLASVLLCLLTLGQMIVPPKMPTAREFRIEQGSLVVLQFKEIEPYLVPLPNGKRLISVATLDYLKGKQ